MWAVHIHLQWVAIGNGPKREKSISIGQVLDSQYLPTEVNWGLSTKYKWMVRLLWHKTLLALVKWKGGMFHNIHQSLYIGLHYRNKSRHSKQCPSATISELLYPWKKDSLFLKIHFLWNNVNVRVCMHRYPAELIIPKCPEGTKIFVDAV